MNRGIVYGIGAYTIWGLLPIYWKALQHVPAAEILTHRMVWSLLFILGLLAVQHNWSWLKTSLKQPRTLLIFFTTAIFLSVNWFTYIWGVNAGFIVETSLGYFINPLISVVLGVLFLRERLRSGQIFALALAAAGVAYLTFRYGSFPWIAITLALTFGFYGLLRKIAPLEAKEGLALETSVLFLPALSYLLYLEIIGKGSFGHVNLTTSILLIGAGIATAIPLLLFGLAARRITLTNLGLLQYIAPTMQFILGVLVYKEGFGVDQMIGFGLIWTALLVYTAEGFWNNRKPVSIPAFEDSPISTD